MPKPRLFPTKGSPYPIHVSGTSRAWCAIEGVRLAVAQVRSLEKDEHFRQRYAMSMTFLDGTTFTYNGLQTGAFQFTPDFPGPLAAMRSFCGFLQAEASGVIENEVFPPMAIAWARDHDDALSIVGDEEPPECED